MTWGPTPADAWPAALPGKVYTQDVWQPTVTTHVWAINTLVHAEEFRTHEISKPNSDRTYRRLPGRHWPWRLAHASVDRVSISPQIA